MPLSLSPPHGALVPRIAGLILLVLAPSASASEQFTQVFNTTPVNTRILRLIGPSNAETLTHTKNGLEIRLPETQKRATQAGIATRFMVTGDFQITVEYELVNVETPDKGYGAGVVLRLGRPEPTQIHAGLGRRKRKDGSDVFNAMVTSTSSGGKPKSTQKFLNAEGTGGKLRLVRTGKTLSFLVADRDDEQFQEMHEIQFDTEPVKSISVLADTGNSDAALEIRIKELSIQADALPAGGTATNGALFTASAIFAASGALLLLGCGIWYMRR